MFFQQISKILIDNSTKIFPLLANYFLVPLQICIWISHFSKPLPHWLDPLKRNVFELATLKMCSVQSSGLIPVSFNGLSIGLLARINFSQAGILKNKQKKLTFPEAHRTRWPCPSCWSERLEASPLGPDDRGQRKRLVWVAYPCRPPYPWGPWSDPPWRPCPACPGCPGLTWPWTCSSSCSDSCGWWSTECPGWAALSAAREPEKCELWCNNAKITYIRRKVEGQPANVMNFCIKVCWHYNYQVPKQGEPTKEAVYYWFCTICIILPYFYFYFAGNPTLIWTKRLVESENEESAVMACDEAGLSKFL